jgi:hypothetical protein
MADARALLVVLAALAMCAGAARAQAPPTTVEGVTVEARPKPVEKQAHDYVQALTAPSYEESLARWTQPICPMVAGLPRDKGEYVLARLTQVAMQARAPLSRKAKCRANFIIVVTDQPEALIAGWRKRNRELFGSAMPPTIRRFVEEERPVRVWRNDTTADTGGAPPADDPTGPRIMRQINDSRLEWNALVTFSSVVVIVDTSRMSGVTFAQLTDYVAMAGLAKLDLDAKLGGAPSILALFREPGAASGLSPWDRAFLKELYATNPVYRLQRVTIARQVAETVAP